MYMRRMPTFFFLVCISAMLFACGSPSNSMRPASTYFEEQCSRVGGAKIYRRVEGVEGIYLMKLRPLESDREWAARDYPGAAMVKEADGDSYIKTFLSYEHSWRLDLPVSQERRGYITPDYQPRNPSNLPGYKYVEAIDPVDNERYRYTFVRKPRISSKIGSIDVILKKEKAEGSPPRYAVTFEYPVNPGERKLGIASVVIKVVDTKTGDVLGEYTQFSRGGAFGSLSASSGSTWLNAERCPVRGGDSHALTRQFVDSVLIPKHVE